MVFNGETYVEYRQWRHCQYFLYKPILNVETLDVNNFSRKQDKNKRISDLDS